MAHTGTPTTRSRHPLPWSLVLDISLKFEVWSLKVAAAALLLAVPALTDAASVTLETELSARGSDFALATNAPVIYITIPSNGAGSNPGSAARVASFNVTFPAVGSYAL